MIFALHPNTLRAYDALSALFEKVISGSELIDATGYEGVIYSGKTTACKRSVQVGGVCALLPDTMEIIGGVTGGGFDVASFVQTQSKVLFIEIEKGSFARRLVEGGVRSVFDRTVFSPIVYAIAKPTILGIADAGMDQIVNAMIELIDRHEPVLLPREMRFLSVSKTEQLARRNRDPHRNSEEILFDKLFDQLYSELAELWESRSCCLASHKR